LWQDESPTPPWKFREAQIPRSIGQPTASAGSALPGPVPRPRRSGELALSNRDLMQGITPGSLAGKPIYKKISENGVPGKLIKFQPEGGHFSILAPSDGVEITYPIIDAQAKLVDLHWAHGDSNGVLYVLMWLKAFNDNSTDATAAAASIDGLLKGMNHAGEQAKQANIVDVSSSKDLKLGGY